MKTYGNATFIDCAGVVSEGTAGHAMRDNCWSCAPFWERVPLCPLSDANGGHMDRTRKLTTNGYCKACRKHFALFDHEREAARVLNFAAAVLQASSEEDEAAANREFAAELARIRGGERDDD